MADTPRSLSALQALLADNTTGDISPQDLRDLLVSLLDSYASLKPPATDLTGTNTNGDHFIESGWTVKTESSGVAAAATGNVTVNSDGVYRIKIVGSVTASSTSGTLQAKTWATPPGGSEAATGYVSAKAYVSSSGYATFVGETFVELTAGTIVRWGFWHDQPMHIDQVSVLVTRVG